MSLDTEKTKSKMSDDVQKPNSFVSSANIQRSEERLSVGKLGASRHLRDNEALSDEDRHLHKEKKRPKMSHRSEDLPDVELHPYNEEDKSKATRKMLKAERKAARHAKSQAPPNNLNRSRSADANLDPDLDNPTGNTYQENVNLSRIPQEQIDTFFKENLVNVLDPKSPRSILRPMTAFSYLPSSYLEHHGFFEGFKRPTPIQAATWPYMFAGRDVIGVAETGSGKTMAFAVPCIGYIQALRKREQHVGPRAVVVSPTRELAIQSYEQVTKLARVSNLRVVCVYGGVPKKDQRAGLQHADIVVATPGRLNDLMSEGSADLSQVGYMVLDEADRMLDKGFEDEVRKIIQAARPLRERQTLMFTATWPESVRELANTFMTYPVKIVVGDSPSGELRANVRIVQNVEVVQPRDKEFRLLQLLKQYQRGSQKDDRILVFCLYKKEASRVEAFIRSKGIGVMGIHGDMSQEQRTRSLNAFKQGSTTVLVATDVAARGLDIPAVKLVINLTYPLQTSDYIHRIGRTGRAGKDGLAITLFTEHDKAHSGALINVLRAADQVVPDELLKFGTTVKKRSHDAYGAFFKEVDTTKTATKIKFD